MPTSLPFALCLSTFPSRRFGFDTKIVRRVIRSRKIEVADRREQDELLGLSRRALDS